MASPIQITGGGFQDILGNALANGYLIFELSKPTSVNGVYICDGVKIKVTLDSSGNVAGTQYLWGNDAMTPSDSYYRVTAYSAQGQPAWGPNNQQVVGSGTFDIGTWVPNQIG
jgi:hypothetical protein